MKLKYFEGVRTLDELKKRYRILATQFHPDHGGDLQTMKEINAEHDELFEVLKHAKNARSDAEHQTTETPEEFRNIVSKLITLDGLEIELCGCWLWISGNTRAHKEELKAAGCRWSKNKGKWYWHHVDEGASHYRRGKSTMEEIRNKYGSRVFNGSADYASPAFIN